MLICFIFYFNFYAGELVTTISVNLQSESVKECAKDVRRPQQQIPESPKVKTKRQKNTVDDADLCCCGYVTSFDR